MSVKPLNYSPTTNIFELLPQEETFEEAARARAAKTPVKKDSQPGSLAAKKMTPAERAQKQKEKETAERKRAEEEKKMIAEALRREEADQDNKEGYQFQSTSAAAAAQVVNKFSRQKYEQLRAQGISFADIEKMEEKEFAAAQANAQPVNVSNKSHPNDRRDNQNYDGNRGGNTPQQNSPNLGNYQGKQANPNYQVKREGNKPAPKQKQHNPGTAFRQQSDNTANREHDKQSQGKYSRKPIAKKGGEGKGNWGNEMRDQSFDQWNNPPTQNTSGDASGWDSTPSSPVPSTKTSKDTQTQTQTQTQNKPNQTSAQKDSNVSQPSTQEAQKPTDKPVVPDPEDEGFGKKTLAEYAREKELERAALAKLVEEKSGKIERRTETDKIDLSKCIENDKEDKKLKQTAGPKGKPKQAKEDKLKILPIHEFIDKDAVLVKPTTSNPKSQRFAAPTDKNFPILGEQPKQKQFPQGRPQSQGQNQGPQGARPQNQNQGQQASGQPQGNRSNQGQGQASGQTSGPQNQNQGQQASGQPQGNRSNQGQGQVPRQGSGQNQQVNRPNQGQGQGQQQNKPQDK